jgi:hypothetical protein
MRAVRSAGMDSLISMIRLAGLAARSPHTGDQGLVGRVVLHEDRSGLECGRQCHSCDCLLDGSDDLAMARLRRGFLASRTQSCPSSSNSGAHRMPGLAQHSLPVAPDAARSGAPVRTLSGRCQSFVHSRRRGASAYWKAGRGARPGAHHKRDAATTGVAADRHPSVDGQEIREREGTQPWYEPAH